MSVSIDWTALWKLVSDQFPMGLHSIHGPAHWRRVERNGLLLATRSGADVTVVRLFALFHDSMRVDDGEDPHHGIRAWRLWCKLDGALAFSAEQAEIFLTACADHTRGKIHTDPTIGVCWDADRLDLTRTGVQLDLKYFSTEAGREMASRKIHTV